MFMGNCPFHLINKSSQWSMLLLLVVVFCYKHMQLHRVPKEGENVFEAFL